LNQLLGICTFSSPRLSNKSQLRRGGLVVCEAASGKKPDQAAKRMRQNQKRRLRNKSRKSEIRSRTRRVSFLFQLFFIDISRII
jgi:small subunit ribosomal protein S20